MSYLDDLVSSARARVAAARDANDSTDLSRRVVAAPDVRPFGAALLHEPLSIIAEIKRASPSAGDIAPQLDATTTAAAYARGGAAAISVLTEPERFKGSVADISSARTAGLPVLRKDFVIDEYQVHEARAAGADAILLIVRIVGSELKRLYQAAADLGMDCLVEVYDERDVERAVDIGASVVGVNHRDLETFEVDPERTMKLAPLLPEGVTLVGLSGVKTRSDVEKLQEAGADAVLVGETLARATDPEATLRELRGVA